MDLKLLDAEPTALERAAIDHLLGPAPTRWEGGERSPGEEGHTARTGHDARSRRHLLLPALHALQEHAGWVSPGGLNYVCKRLDVPPADAYGVATFYALLAVEPRPPRVVHVCEDLACRCHGSQELIAQLEERVGPEGEDVDGATWFRSPCLGQCDRAPAAMLTIAGVEPSEQVLAPVTTAEVLEILAGDDVTGAEFPRIPQFGDPSLRLLRRVGHVRPTSLDDYRAHGGYAALRRASRSGPTPCSARSRTRNCSAAAAPPSRPASSGRRSRASPHGRTT